MKKSGILVLSLSLFGCGELEPSISKESIKKESISTECMQAKNRVIVYTDSLNELKNLYSDDINSSEAKRRIDAMQARIGSAKIDVNIQCKRH